MEILEQFMEVDPSHLRKYCASEKIAAKYPICEFLLELFNSNGALSVKMGTILHCLLGQEGTDTHEIREMLKPCILSHFLSRTLPKDQ